MPSDYTVFGRPHVLLGGFHSVSSCAQLSESKYIPSPQIMLCSVVALQADDRKKYEEVRELIRKLMLTRTEMMSKKLTLVCINIISYYFQLSFL